MWIIHEVRPFPSHGIRFLRYLTSGVLLNVETAINIVHARYVPFSTPAASCPIEFVRYDTTTQYHLINIGVQPRPPSTVTGWLRIHKTATRLCADVMRHVSDIKYDVIHRIQQQRE